MTWVRIAALFTLALQLSCGGDDENLGVGNVSPKGSVGGVIIDAATMKPMEGVQVTVIAGGSKYPGAGPATSDSAGYFSVADVPPGALLIQVTPKDTAAFHGVTIAATLDNAAGDFPLGNATLSLGPVGLVPLTKKETAFTVQLVTADGAPAPASVKAFLRASLEWVDFSTGAANPKGLTVSASASDNSGRLAFVGMPDFALLAGLVGSGGVSDQVRIQIPPFDTNKDGILDFMGKEVVYNVNQLDGTIPTIVLSSSKAPTKLSIEAASIAALAGGSGNRVMSSVSGPVYVTFNLPIRDDLTELALFDEAGQPVVSVPTKSVSDNVLTVNLPGLKPGAEYNLNIRTFADVESGTLLEGYFGAPVFTPVQAGTPVSATLGRDPANPNKIVVTFNTPVGSGTPGKHLSGTNAVLYFDYDIDGSGIKGDAPGERGASSSNVNMYIDEVDPPGPAGPSGLGSRWYFILPVDAMANPLPAGTVMDMSFSQAGFAFQQADGKLVPDMKNKVVP